MTDITLYAASRSRAVTARWMLEEVGEPYTVQLLDLAAGDTHTPEYLALNPMGKVPTIKHGDVVVSEVAAIAVYLADAFPAAGLAPAIGDPRRGPYLKWCFWGPSCIEPAMMQLMLKFEVGRGTAGWGDPQLVMDVLADAVREGPWLLGDQFTAADVVVGSAVMSAMMFGLFPERDEFVAYRERLSARPARQRTVAAEEEAAAG
ncbi:MAG: glutathione S-transferase family protein [Maricaulaceae bacterium]|jgi:glutathione S-transferase